MYNRFLKLIHMFQRPHVHPTNLNILKAPRELKTMNSKPQINFTPSGWRVDFIVEYHAWVELFIGS